MCLILLFAGFCLAQKCIRPGTRYAADRIHWQNNKTAANRKRVFGTMREKEERFSADFKANRSTERIYISSFVFTRARIAQTHAYSASELITLLFYFRFFFFCCFLFSFYVISKSETKNKKNIVRLVRQCLLFHVCMIEQSVWVLDVRRDVQMAKWSGMHDCVHTE